MVPLKELFRPITIGSREFKNRIVMAPIGTNLALPDGSVSDRLIGYLNQRARGGVALIISEDVTVAPKTSYIKNTLGFFEDRFIEGWSSLCHKVHASGAKIMPQLIHPSFNSRFSLTGVQPVAASPIPSRASREIPRELTIKEIEAIIDYFGQSARRAQEAGCDGVQVHCAHCHHLLGSFISALYNKRADAYGGDIEGRLKLPLEVIQRIRWFVGDDFPIIVRISADEGESGGRGIQESQYVAKRMAQAGADAFHISAGTTNSPWLTIPPMGTPQAPNAPLAAEVKQVVNVPVIVVGRITNPYAAEKVLACGQADMVAMGRALVADPDWPLKAAADRSAEIVPCVGDSACLSSVMSDRAVTCLINPCVGREEEMALTPSSRPKNVLVVGGGPAGLEAARVAACRGHKVTLIEKTSCLGGQLLTAAFPPLKQEIVRVVQYLAAQVDRTGVEVILNTEATMETVKKLNPDVAIVATGARPFVPETIPGVGGKNVITAWDALRGRALAGPRILIVGGGQTGCETADFLANPVNDFRPGGNQVTIMELLPHLAVEERGAARSLLIQRIAAKGVKFITSARLACLLPDGARYLRNGREEEIRDMDTIIMAMGTRPETGLSQALEGLSIPLFVIGDAKKPRRALEAIAEGAEIGRQI